MGDTLRWPKDTADIVKKRASEVQEMTKAQASLHLRLQVADDIRAFNNKEFSGITQKEILATIDLFCFCAEQAQVLVDKIKTAKDKAGVLEAFSGQCAAKFSDRGGNVLMKSEEMFAEYPGILFSYLQRGLVDLATCWSAHSADVRKLFVRAVLDSPKNYPTTLEATEMVVFADAKTLIQKWRPPASMSMSDVLEDWLEGEANDSIYTGIAASGLRQTKKDQLKQYVNATKSPEAYHMCWYSIVGKVILKKDFSWNNHNEVIAFFRQNVPALSEAFKGMVPEEDIREFVNGYLPKLLANPVFKQGPSVAASGTIEYAVGELNKLREVPQANAIKLMRAANDADRQKLIDEFLSGKTLTRGVDDRKCVFERYDATTKKYSFKLL